MLVYPVAAKLAPRLLFTVLIPPVKYDIILAVGIILKFIIETTIERK